MKATGNVSPSLSGKSREGGTPEGTATWRLETFLGRLAELSGGPATAALTLAFRLVLEAQRLGEPVAWITGRGSSFFPPDAADAGVDLDTLAVIRLPAMEQMARAADLLARSGGFGLVVLDLGRHVDLPLAAQTRLAGLARKHRTALLFLTEAGDRPSLGSLISLRGEASRAGKGGGGRKEEEEHRFRCEVRVLRDKRLGIGWRHREVCRGPHGLR